MPCPDVLHNLVERFREQLPDYKRGQYNETQLRRDFLDPLFRLLGWDVDNSAGYAETFREILESPRLPPAARVAAAAGEIRALSLAQLHTQGRARLAHLQARYGETDQFPDEWYEQAVANGAYLQELTRPQLEAILFLDYMKAALGRQPGTSRQAARSRESAERALP